MNNVKKGKRPKFFDEDKIEPEIKDLIEKCWAQNPEKRPTFEEIFYELCKMSKPDNKYIQGLKKKLEDEKKKFMKNFPLIDSLIERISNQEDELKNQSLIYDKKIADLEFSIEGMINNITLSNKKNEQSVKNDFNTKNSLLSNKIDSMNNQISKQIKKSESQSKFYDNKINELKRMIDDITLSNKNIDIKIEQCVKNETDSKNALLSSNIDSLKDQIIIQRNKISDLESNIEKVSRSMSVTRKDPEINMKIESIKKENDSLKVQI